VSFCFAKQINEGNGSTSADALPVPKHRCVEDEKIPLATSDKCADITAVIRVLHFSGLLLSATETNLTTNDS
jgi:hypothetical protein